MRITTRLRLRLKLQFHVWARLKANHYPHYNLSHSQIGEDMVVRWMTRNSSSGFYVDIGAFHPIIASNTYHFYCRGWRGINIDATPGCMEPFRVLRPRDVNLELCIAPTQQAQAAYYMYSSPDLNSLDPDSQKIAAQFGARLLETKLMPTMTITECFDRYVPKSTAIDLLSIDVEGLDEAILLSNDWTRYQPHIIIFERHDLTCQDLFATPLMQELSRWDYELVAKCGPSFIVRNTCALPAP